MHPPAAINLRHQHIPHRLRPIPFSLEQPALSYLHYPDFFTDPHPALHSSIKIQLQTGELSYRPRYGSFAALTRQQDALGLLNDSRTIGTRNGWRNRLSSHRIEIIDHALACPLPNPSPNKTGPIPTGPIPTGPIPNSHPSPQHSSRDRSPLPAATTPQIDRHRAAIHRNALSKPVRLALEAGLLTPETRFFDYGCGHGGDIKRLSQKGFTSNGWDPYYRPNQPPQAADIINLGYVINVIEDPQERHQALLQAWSLTNHLLIVSAQVLIDDRSRGLVAYEDGIITSRNTFQKYYEQEELKAYIDQVLASAAPAEPIALDAIPVALGIYQKSSQCSKHSLAGLVGGVAERDR
ncbi:MAG: DNA phosphorothioation-associated putative methyltransferase [Synechococcales cyanobacterium RM1_1_8]|nr:DNA phosphorothioation-associated putative methyltransferase [Synechococcales cyanobacterium RM1_1_8]